MEISGLRARIRAGLCAREQVRRQCHRFYLVHDGPGHWVVEGAARGVHGQAGLIEQQVNPDRTFLLNAGQPPIPNPPSPGLVGGGVVEASHHPGPVHQ